MKWVTTYGCVNIVGRKYMYVQHWISKKKQIKIKSKQNGSDLTGDILKTLSSVEITVRWCWIKKNCLGGSIPQ